ncbi:hypothetical protein BN2475_1070001 [Paraburkholderia ribeironis]|uniref:Uncharacterized protein n=1 Tax=Paraburkholderia ribeironis TaxID=1247936 RepID=A0A1N7SNV8_9BURK|nr:hypothetical protein BN2475_1070001 [Paraburkholderia ribeironis]
MTVCGVERPSERLGDASSEGPFMPITDVANRDAPAGPQKGGGADRPSWGDVTATGTPMQRPPAGTGRGQAVLALISGVIRAGLSRNSRRSCTSVNPMRDAIEPIARGLFQPKLTPFGQEKISW